MIELLSDCNWATLTCVPLGQFQTNPGMKLSTEVLARFPKTGLTVSPEISSINGGQSRSDLGLMPPRCPQERSIRSRPLPKSVAPSTTGWLKPMVATSLVPGRCTQGPWTILTHTDPYHNLDGNTLPNPQVGLIRSTFLQLVSYPHSSTGHGAAIPILHVSQSLLWLLKPQQFHVRRGDVSYRSYLHILSTSTAIGMSIYIYRI